MHLTLAISDYEHVREIAQGLVRADGITLTPLIFPSIEEITFRFTSSLEWDVSELSFGKYISLTRRARADGGDPGVPVARASPFRDLCAQRPRHPDRRRTSKARAVGIPEWAQTAGIYVRGFLAEEYGVDLTKIRWLQAGVNEPGRAEKVELKLPAGIRYEPRPETSLYAMLASGEVDAVISARAPRGVRARRAGGAAVSGLSRRGGAPVQEDRHLPDHASDDDAARGVRAASLDRDEPVQDVRRGQAALLERLRDFTCARIPLPWAAAIADEIVAGYGPDPFPYGIEESRPTHRGVLPLRPRPGRDPPADDGGRSVPARGARDGKGVIFKG